MKILRNVKVPTGNILIVSGEKGKLECLSIGDYGKAVNMKADFMGLNSSGLERVRHTNIMPLSEKWVVTISSQYGCSMGCTFCDVPKVGPGVNATVTDLLDQCETALSLHPEIKHTKRLNVHFARMGEPTWNQSVLSASVMMQSKFYPYVGDSLIHPVVSTMLPENNTHLVRFLTSWMDIKNERYHGDAGLQLSINSTNNDERSKMFNGNAVTIERASRIGKSIPSPVGRKITLNFAVADYEIDAEKLRDLFDPRRFIVKLTPMHKTATAIANGIKTHGDYTTLYPYSHIEESLKRVGFDVLVFIASEHEDLGRITCGNAILSGTKPEV